MSSDNKLIWIFVTFLVAIEAVSDTNVSPYFDTVDLLRNQLLIAKRRSTIYKILLKLFH